jgi:hypothetical protein
LKTTVSAPVAQPTKKQQLCHIQAALIDFYLNEFIEKNWESSLEGTSGVGRRCQEILQEVAAFFGTYFPQAHPPGV